MIEISGESEEDKKLWFTYLSWPRGILKDYFKHEPALVDENNRRFDKKYSDSLQSILFSCMVMEYRIMRTLEYKGIQYRKRDAFGTLIEILWTKLENVKTEKSKRKCKQPKGWVTLRKRLDHWATARNVLVHGNYIKLQEIVPRPKAISEAKKCYNDMVELIKILNGALEYYEGTRKDFIKYMNCLKLH